MAKKFADGEMGVATPSLKLSKTNYRVWSMTMEVYLDSHDLWQTIVGENPTKKKDRQALSKIRGEWEKDYRRNGRERGREKKCRKSRDHEWGSGRTPQHSRREEDRAE